MNWIGSGTFLVRNKNVATVIECWKFRAGHPTPVNTVHPVWPAVPDSLRLVNHVLKSIHGLTTTELDNFLLLSCNIRFYVLLVFCMFFVLIVVNVFIKS